MDSAALQWSTSRKGHDGICRNPPAPLGQLQDLLAPGRRSQGSQTFVEEDAAVAHRNRLLVDWDEGTWIDPRRGRIAFHEWAAQWWQTWAGDPDRSPNSLDSTESRLRLHIQPYFGPMQLRAIRPQHVQRWQNKLKGQLGHAMVMACRSVLFRILKAAEED